MMLRRTFTILIVLLFLCSSIALLPGISGEEGKSFSDNQLVSGIDPQGLDQMNPAMAIGPDGNISVVWEEYDETGFPSIYIAVSQDGGESFSEKRMVNSSESEQADARIAADSLGNIYVIWVEPGPYGTRLIGAWHIFWCFF